MALWSVHGLAAAVSGSLRRGLSTAAPHPPWAMIDGITFQSTSAQRVSLELAASPGVSRLVVPQHLMDLGPRPPVYLGSDILRVHLGRADVTSEDGLLLLNFMDVHMMAPVIATHRSPPPRNSTDSTFNLKLSTSGTTQERKFAGYNNPDITRFVCNPITGQLCRLPDIDGTKKTMYCRDFGLLTQSPHRHGAPDRYAVASLGMDGNGNDKSFVMRRYLSQTGEWEKLVRLSSPVPLARPFCIHPLHEVLAFAGRVWWIDLNLGAVTADPFSDRPELSFVELPRGRLLHGPSSPAQASSEQVMFQRMGVSEGRLHYVEMSYEPPFMLSSFALGDDGCSWTLEHQVALGPLQAFEEGRHSPWIGAIDPLNASIVCLIVGDFVVVVDMDKRMVLGHSQLGKTVCQDRTCFDTHLLSCVLPPWLGSSQIPSAGKMEGAEKKTLADILVRSGSDYKR